MFKGILVHLQTNNIAGARNQLKKYFERNPVFRMNPQCKFLFDFMERIDQHDIEGVDAIRETFKLRNVIDSWLSNRLVDLRRYADGGLLDVMYHCCFKMPDPTFPRIRERLWCLRRLRLSYSARSDFLWR
jgi:hypothetical protein